MSATILANSSGARSQSVLAKFSGLTGREVAVVVVKPLAANLGPTALAEPSTLVKDEEVVRESGGGGDYCGVFVK